MAVYISMYMIDHGEQETNKRIGRNIRILRAQKGLRQRYVSNLLGITPNGFGKIERGESSLTVERLELLARILGVSVPDIIHFNPEQSKNQPQLIEADDAKEEQIRQQMAGFREQLLVLQEKVLEHSKILEILLKKKR